MNQYRYANEGTVVSNSLQALYCVLFLQFGHQLLPFLGLHCFEAPPGLGDGVGAQLLGLEVVEPLNPNLFQELDGFAEVEADILQEVGVARETELEVRFLLQHFANDVTTGVEVDAFVTIGFYHPPSRRRVDLDDHIVRDLEHSIDDQSIDLLLLFFTFKVILQSRETSVLEEIWVSHHIEPTREGCVEPILNV